MATSQEMAVLTKKLKTTFVMAPTIAGVSFDPQAPANPVSQIDSSFAFARAQAAAYAGGLDVAWGQQPWEESYASPSQLSPGIERSPTGWYAEVMRSAGERGADAALRVPAEGVGDSGVGLIGGMS